MQAPRRVNSGTTVFTPIRSVSRGSMIRADPKPVKPCVKPAVRMMRWK